MILGEAEKVVQEINERLLNVLQTLQTINENAEEANRRLAKLEYLTEHLDI